MSTLTAVTIEYLRKKFPKCDEAELKRRAEIFASGIPVRLHGGLLNIDALLDDAFNISGDKR